MIDSKPKVYIAGIGMVTPLGANTAMTIAAVNAGINVYQASSFCNTNGKAMITTSVPSDVLPVLNKEFENVGLSAREKRIIQLASPALKEALSLNRSVSTIPLFLAGPEALPSGAKIITGKILADIASQTEVKIDLTNSRYFASGRTGLLDAIDLAFKYFTSINSPYVLVGGVDSYLDAATLGYLDAQDRVLAESVNNAFAPGEGAGFILLSSDPNLITDPIKTVLYQPGFGCEKGHIHSDEPYLGQGLSDAFSLAIANGSGKKISSIISSMNGEGIFAKEYGVAYLRNSMAFSDSCSHQHPVDCFGDLGSATAPALIALAQSQLFHNGQETQQLVYCSSDFENRAALCVSNVS